MSEVVEVVLSRVVIQEKDDQQFIYLKERDGTRSFPIVIGFNEAAEINRKMREQEKNWPKSKRKTRAAYLARLRRTAMSLPSDYIGKVIGNLQKRCTKLVNAKGGRFIEGGDKGLI